MSVLGLSACAPTTKAVSPSTMATTSPASASLSLKPTPLLFDVDQRFWAERDVGPTRNPGILALRAFSRQKATSEAECPSALVVVAETVARDIDLVMYSAGKRTGMPPHTMEKVFSHLDGMLRLTNAVGYRVRGTRGCQPVVHMVHAREGSVGYNILIEVDPRDYAAIEAEILTLLKSFRISSLSGLI